MEKPCALAQLGTIWLESSSQGKKTQGCSGEVECKLVVLPDSRKGQQWTCY